MQGIRLERLGSAAIDTYHVELNQMPDKAKTIIRPKTDAYRFIQQAIQFNQSISIEVVEEA